MQVQKLAVIDIRQEVMMFTSCFYTFTPLPPTKICKEFGLYYRLRGTDV